MASTTYMTADELLALPSDGNRHELIRGELHMMSPAGEEHGYIAMCIASEMYHFVQEHELGAVYAAETGFIIEHDPDTIRAPDAAFVSQKHINQQPPGVGYRRGAPDLAVEVISPSETYEQVDQKVAQWLGAGCRLVWVINPRRQTVKVFDCEAPSQITVLNVGDCVTGGDVLPGFELPVQKLFR